MTPSPDRLAALQAAMRERPRTLAEIVALFGTTKAAAESQIERYRNAGLVVCLRGFRGGKGGITKWGNPDQLEAMRATVLAQREERRREQNKRKNYRYRARLAGIDPDGDGDIDLPIRRRVLQQWTPQRPRGPVSVFDLGRTA